MKSKQNETLIYIEDDLQMREFVKSDLTQALDAEIIAVGNCDEALRIIESKYPDAVLADIMMPGMNGIELLERVRGLGLETPFIFMTGNMSPMFVKRALSLGASHFIEKPCDHDALMSTVKTVIQLGKMMKQMDLSIETLCASERVSKKDLLLLKRSYKEIKDLKQSLWAINHDIRKPVRG